MELDGYSWGSGHGEGYGYGGEAVVGWGDGFAYGWGDGSGFGSGNERGNMSNMAAFLKAIGSEGNGSLTARRALDMPNAELRRMCIEAIGPDKFFQEIGGEVLHEDTDGAGNRRRLIRAKVKDAESGYLYAVHVVCPTTGREYYLGVEPGMKTCQEAVASTFGLKADEYHPVRES